MTKTTPASMLLHGVAFIAAYFVLAHVGVPLRIGSIDASPIWLPHGLSLAAVLVLGPRFWPAVMVAVALRAFSGGLPLTTAVGLGLAKTAEVLLARYLMRGPGGFTGALDNVRSVIALVLGGSVVASVPGAALSVLWIAVTGLAEWSRFTELTLTWWVGDAMGAIIVVPLALAVVTPRRWSFDRSSVTALAIILASLFVTCELAFGGLVAPALGMPFAYLAFSFIFWASLRFGVHGAALTSSIAALHATIGTLRGLGPFVGESPIESLFMLEAFMAVMVLTGLLLGAVISERRAVAQALRDSQQRHRLASAAGRAGVWDWDLETGSFYVDPVLKNILGYEDHEIANSLEDWRDLIHPDDLGLVRRSSQQHFDGETGRFEVEHRMIHKDGSVRWFLARGEAQRDAWGVPVRLSGTDVDITRHKRAEEALEAGEQQIREQLSELEHIYQTAPVGLALTDRDHRFVRINERLASMTGWSVEEHLGRSVRELMPHVAEFLEPTMRHVIETGEPRIEEMETSTPAWSGTALVGHFPLQGAGRKVHGVGLIVQDITAHKKAEALQAGNNRALELVARGSSLDGS